MNSQVQFVSIDRANDKFWKAGLFSAVVTSFVVDSSKDLQPDPNTLLLFHIATLIANGTAAARIPPEIRLSPSPSSYWINAFWFASLVLSLATVLVGIVSLQWIREHQRYSGLSSEEKFGIICMRKEALEAWHVPQIFGGLPLLLQGALVLYLVGLVEHLRGFGPKVAIPGIVFIALSLFFLVVTTVLPTLQGVVVLPAHLEITLNLPFPCPYKSPQSQAFRQLMIKFERSFLATSWLMAQVQWVIMHFRKLLYQFIRLEASQPRFVETSHRFSSILTIWGKASWIDFDLSWLSFRDCMFLNITDDRLLNQYFGLLKPNYDAIKGIRSIARGNQMNTSERSLFAQFHCLHDISSSVVKRNVGRVLTETYRNEYFQLLLTLKSSNNLDHRTIFLTDMLAISNCIPEENILAILDIVDPSHVLSQTISRHFAECNLRVLTTVFAEIRRKSESQRLTISPFSLSYAVDNIKETGTGTVGSSICHFTIHY